MFPGKRQRRLRSTRALPPPSIPGWWLRLGVALCIFWVGAVPGGAGTLLGPWTPLFQGVDQAAGTNTPDGTGFPNLSVAHFVRVDLSDPGIHTFATPPCPDFIPDVQETSGMTVSTFVATYGVQVAINANFFDLLDPFAPAGTPMLSYGLHVSQGRLVVAQESPDFTSSLAFSTNNRPTLIPTNWPAQPVPEGTWTAVTGSYPLLLGGANQGFVYLGNPAHLHQINPRSALGLSADHRYLYLLAVDGRQPGYSDGTYDWETAAWLQVAGAWDAINLDGGGSTALVMQDTNGAPVELNQSSSVAQYGLERTVASHFGIYAAPLPFVRQLAANPDDTAATITWTTAGPATTQVRYGLTTNLGLLSSTLGQTVTGHAMLLTKLIPGTGYYYQAVSFAGATQYVSGLGYFTTTNYVRTQRIFELTNQWRFTTANQNGIAWAAPGHDDTAWEGSGAGFFWGRPNLGYTLVGPNTSIQPRGARLSVNPANGQPYSTYYFRAHFTRPNAGAPLSLMFSNVVNDGAVFYLNGVELTRLRLPASPLAISNATPALAQACAGGGLCPDLLGFTGTALTNLTAGDNVLAVELHLYPTATPNPLFGAVVDYTYNSDPGPQLQIAPGAGRTVVLNWSRGGYQLQEAIRAAGPWRNVGSSVYAGPFPTSPSGSTHFYRLVK